MAMMQRAVTVVLACAFLGALHENLRADETFTWSGLAIQGEAGVEYPDFAPEGEAVFSLSGSTLTVAVTYTGATETILGQNQALTGLTWDLDGFGGALTATSAMVASGSSLIGVNSDTWTGGDDLSGQWAFKSDIAAGDLGSYGVGAVGDVNFGEDTFGSADIIDPSKTLVEPVPNGTDFGIVGPDIDLSSDGYASQGPFVQNSMFFTFEVSGVLSEDMIMNVRPIFGSEGAPLVPEPATILLFAAGLGGVGLAGIRRRRQAQA